jgi:hypothetical protein
MGTNYYWHDRPCEHCGRYETIHVGKQSGGWTPDGPVDRPTP